jgi:mono/diheme cytochrome c family protein
MARPLILAWLAAVSAGLCGCGGSGHGPTSAAATTAAFATTAASGPTASSGRALFAQACGACHTLTGHNDSRHQGGDLLGFHASRTQFVQLASEMPVRRPLSRGQLQAVVRFVRAVEAGRP